MKVLVTGGAGYIGSHVVLACLGAGHEVVVIDDLSTGRREAVPRGVPLIVGDVGDAGLVAKGLETHEIAAVIHMAGKVVVPESVASPLLYYRANTAASRSLIAACAEAGVKSFVFSSTAAVYGAPKETPVTEDAPLEPINPYGRSKLMTEWILADAAAAHGFGCLALRYFNVAGADPRGRAGQSTPQATHLIKVASEAAVGLRDKVEIFGQDYETPDGTCIRDYIHVSDLAAAQVAALRYLAAGGRNRVMNCGYGRGYSVREVLATVEQVNGRPLTVVAAPRRPGDPPVLVADPSRLMSELDWRPQHADLAAMIESAIGWEKILMGPRKPQAT
ncbi:MAG: UDP-glucose 4-epimerase GalE [Kiloniellales bacterium]|nr:UDP-glucose 4-epimerase GalE [Kiloniellales bacterium]